MPPQTMDRRAPRYDYYGGPPSPRYRRRPSPQYRHGDYRHRPYADPYHRTDPEEGYDRPQTRRRTPRTPPRPLMDIEPGYRRTRRPRTPERPRPETRRSDRERPGAVPARTTDRRPPPAPRVPSATTTEPGETDSDPRPNTTTSEAANSSELDSGIETATEVTTRTLTDLLKASHRLDAIATFTREGLFPDGYSEKVRELKATFLPTDCSQETKRALTEAAQTFLLTGYEVVEKHYEDRITTLRDHLADLRCPNADEAWRNACARANVGLKDPLRASLIASVRNTLPANLRSEQAAAATTAWEPPLTQAPPPRTRRPPSPTASDMSDDLPPAQGAPGSTTIATLAHGNHSRDLFEDVSFDAVLAAGPQPPPQRPAAATPQTHGDPFEDVSFDVVLATSPQPPPQRPAAATPQTRGDMAPLLGVRLKPTTTPKRPPTKTQQQTPRKQ